MRKILCCLILLAVVFVSLGCSGEGKYKKHIEELNQKLPQGTESIRLDKMAVEDGAFKCYYTILIEMPLPTEDELSRAKVLLIDRIKHNPEFKMFVDDELDFYFVYLNPDGKEIWNVKITPSDYQ